MCALCVSCMTHISAHFLHLCQDIGPDNLVALHLEHIKAQVIHLESTNHGGATWLPIALWQVKLPAK